MHSTSAPENPIPPHESSDGQNLTLPPGSPLRQEAARRTRRSFIVGGLAALGSVLGWRYLLHRPDAEGTPLPFRRVHDAEVAAAASEFEMRPPTGSFDQHHDELQQQRQDALDDLHRLEADILHLLPTRDEWVKVNLGYGPSRVGAWRVPNAADSKAEHYEIRVVL